VIDSSEDDIAGALRHQDSELARPAQVEIGDRPEKNRPEPPSSTSEERRGGSSRSRRDPARASEEVPACSSSALAGSRCSVEEMSIYVAAAAASGSSAGSRLPDLSEVPADQGELAAASEAAGAER